MSICLVRNSHLLSLARFGWKGNTEWELLRSKVCSAESKFEMYAYRKQRYAWHHRIMCTKGFNKVIVIGDGQVTLGNEIIKPNVRKVRRLGTNVIGGFAGDTADSFTLCLRDSSLSLKSTLLTRVVVELAKTWRTDKFLRRLDAVMVVSDAEISLTITGNGDVLEPYDGVIGVGSGGSYASAAARAFIDLPDWDPEAIAKKAMKIAADCCIYTNHYFTIEQIDVAQKNSEDVKQAAALYVSEPCTTSN